MSLSSYRVGAAVAVSDMDRARDFYEDTLGLTARGDDPDGGRTYECGDQTTLHVFPSPRGAGGSGATIAGWAVDDLERVVDELTAKGVTFERYDELGITTDEKGIAVMGDSKGAWFKDPDGNILGLIQA
jgi:catechol 2,3-dioxygenase-like lactoylglutathione lyase family enzyme